ncbi:tripartite tricarboxylate transporter substrate binding protein [Pusillimonas harenae]|uniref:Tripartite tricarboxylate transporter substrate binding protein n=2 Tax=Pollutimonas harenae TaxID=657015 RepID=A0A853GNA8_9BURK|nr:tripartite tricarboxylate transporter substrate binding protein [Pollutimonas harenae]NYT84498.1 tripartite tricarboxylate transporter substrate binding protein [Pollutimonas harenae]TEA73645.1 tripartite tricarboxylate transporter substrate binding protein [Pollutimonas harenae]
MLSASSLAAEYPSKPIELIVPYAAGGATDVIARLVATDVSKELGQTIVAVNKPGAGTTLAAAEVARKKNDGYTLYMTTAAHTISGSLYKNLTYDPIADFTPITLVARIPIVLVTAPSLKVSTLAEYIEFAKKQPEGVTVGSPGNGSPQHLTQVLFKERTGTHLLHIPYRGDAPMLNDLLAGQVQSAFVTLSAALPHIQAGKLNALAVANPARIPAIPDVPTMTEAGLKGFNAATWFGLFGPKDLPAEVPQTLFKASHKVVAAPEFTQRLEAMGAEIVNIGPDDFQKLVKKESAQWAKAVKASGARVD